MFFKTDWVPLSDLAHTVRIRRMRERLEERIASLTPGAPPVEGSRNREIFEIWQICGDADRVGVLLRNGKIVDAPKRLVEWSGEHSASNQHVNLYVGTVGSSEHNHDVGRPISAEELSSRYGAFLGLPILLPESCMELALGAVQPITWMDDAADEDADTFSAPKPQLSQSPSAVAERIVEAYDAGERLTKAEYRQIFAPDLSIRSFELGWKLAVEERPELSRPGRRP